MSNTLDKSRFYMRSASADDNDALCRISTIPMRGSIQLALERYPDYFKAAEIQNNEIEIALCCDRQADGEIAGVACLGRRKVFFEGKSVWVRYLSDLRVLEKYRGMRLARMIAEYISDVELNNPSRLMQSIVFSDNLDIKRFGNHPEQTLSNMKHLWCYKLGDYKTSAIRLAATKRKHHPDYEVRRATLNDLPGMQELFDIEACRKNFYPTYRFDQLADSYYHGLAINNFFLAFRTGKLVGITGSWDQCEMKQTRIVGYSGILHWCRPLLNILSRSMTGISLPKPGTKLLSFYLHTIVTMNNNPDIFRDLVEYIYDVYRNTEYSYFVCGLFSDDALSPVMDHFKSRRDVYGGHYQVGVDEVLHPVSPNRPMYIEACRI